MEKKTKQSYNILVLGLLTLLATFTWVSFELHRNFTKPSQATSPVTSYHTTELSPTLDTVTLSALQNRLVATPSQAAPPQLPITTAEPQPATPAGSL